ncbi:MAG: hypothetical protein HY907_01755 [Deltaproteobacteria bacterium]|nr:hypothetical protein [Deltaproteobacteria bacterium]
MRNMTLLGWTLGMFLCGSGCPRDAGGGGAGAAPPPADLVPVAPTRTILVSGSCGGNACTPASVESLTITPDGAFVAYVALGWSDYIPAPEPRAAVRLASWTDPALDRQLEARVCSEAGAVAAALHPGGDRVAVAGLGQGRMVALGGEADAPLLWRGVAGGAATGIEEPAGDAPRFGDDDWAPRQVIPEGRFCDGPRAPAASSAAWSPSGEALALGGYAGSGEAPGWGVWVLDEVGGELRHVWAAPEAVIGVRVTGWESRGTLVVRTAELPSADATEPGADDILYRVGAGGGAPEEFGRVDANAGTFVLDGRPFTVFPDGAVRDVADGRLVARLELPASPVPAASERGRGREVTAVAAQPGGEVAVALADSVRISVGVAPCCTRLLLFSGVTLR